MREYPVPQLFPPNFLVEKFTKKRYDVIALIQNNKWSFSEDNEFKKQSKGGCSASKFDFKRKYLKPQCWRSYNPSAMQRFRHKNQRGNAYGGCLAVIYFKAYYLIHALGITRSIPPSGRSSCHALSKPPIMKKERKLAECADCEQYSQHDTDDLAER